ncbi:MAG: phosphonate ABC transporter, permease protein PhnE [Deltaproteobacteria bacterium RIFCSPHIGHO2_12_FULL_43_9]|nr:MAG: phosphonate ABC transporter, permease protein PhnE [Deltaproteobacteria bacterium RIFCSPHIGHO2_12_FULL_43_9]
MSTSQSMTMPKINIPTYKREKSRVVRLIILTLILAATYWSMSGVEFSVPNLIKGLPFMWDFIRRMYPPNWSILGSVFVQTVITIQLALAGTIIAAIISLPISFLAARNICGDGWLVRTMTFLFNADRSIDALILALFFVSAVGLGPFPGVLALAIHSIGMLGKLFAEAIEGVDKGPIEALESVGASKLEIIRWAILPQAIPYFISYTLFRFELNIRVAIVLGVVGAGGIGFLLVQYMRLFQYQSVTIVVGVILVLVMGIDGLSTRLRRAVL